MTTRRRGGSRGRRTRCTARGAQRHGPCAAKGAGDVTDAPARVARELAQSLPKETHPFTSLQSLKSATTRTTDYHLTKGTIPLALSFVSSRECVIPLTEETSLIRPAVPGLANRSVRRRALYVADSRRHYVADSRRLLCLNNFRDDNVLADGRLVR
jgi:hypothetical protein